MSQHAAEQAADAGAATEAPARFRASHRALTDALKVAALAVPPRPSVPTLGGVVAHAQGRSVTLSAYDGDVRVSVTVPADAGGNGRSVLDYDELKKTLAAAVAGETKAAAAQTPVDIEGGQVSTPQVSVPVRVHPLEEYPRLPPTEAPAATVDGAEFFRQLGRVLPAAGGAKALPTFTTVRLELTTESLRMAATDRYRIAVADIPAQPWESDHDDQAATQVRAALVPVRVLAQIAKHLGKYTGPIALGIRHESESAMVTLAIGTAEITIRRYPDGFPKVESFFPAERHLAVSVSRTAVAKAAKKAHALTKAKGITGGSAMAEWDADGGMTLAPYYGCEDQARVKGAKVTAHIAHGSAADLQGRTLTLDAEYLLTALDAFTSDTVTLHLQADSNGQFDRPIVFTEGQAVGGDGYRHLLNPVRLD
ncbi:hypothetical protein OHA27_37930 [Streptomyces sp. NBC_01619]|uniref:DNA polymerase III subunit beta family protein n=1 Tax=Streptomyces sp. NBC_01619 TaxID=2975901 RepID=UPI002257F6F4|nr:hypothetical protein [Streptomyces sp. NBC_01619]MCX4515901.1 hypothetical protein [Streptomyces sp. NBC_01619]